MNYIIQHISNFLQGYLIKEQFVWNIPAFILCFLGILNELQNIAFINAPCFNKISKMSYETFIIKIISRPNQLVNNDIVLSYFTFFHINCFLIISFLFAYIIRDRKNNMVVQLNQLFHDSLLLKIVIILLNISINMIKFGYGFLVFEISLFQINERFESSYHLALNCFNLIFICPLILTIINLFSYNWALDFQKEYMTINDSNFTVIRILIRFVQIFISVRYQDDKIIEYFQILLPILNSIIAIYQMQKQKMYIYGFYYQILLFINIMEITLAFQYLISLLFFQIIDQRSLWILISLLPFYYLKQQTKQKIEEDYFNNCDATIECNNFILYQMIYNLTKNKDSYNIIQQYVYIFRHRKKCKVVGCNCNSIAYSDIQQFTLDIYIQDLLNLYKTQLNCMSFKCSKDQIVFSYLQLLFFKKKYLSLYKYFEITFPNSSEIKQEKFLADIHSKAFQLKNFYKLSVLRVAQCLIKMDIEKEFRKQKTSLCKDAQKYHKEIQDYICYENQKKKIHNILSSIIKAKIDFYTNTSNQKQRIRAFYQLIEQLEQGKKKIKSLNKTFSQKQNLLVFYCMELLNDLISAFNYTLERNQNQNTQTKIIDSQFSNNLSYLLIQIQDQNRIKIIQQKFKDINFPSQNVENFSYLIPKYILDIHPIMIDGFISGNNNRFFQQFNETYLQLEYGIVRKIDLIMDVYEVNLMNIQMIIFLKEQKDNRYDILIDQQNNIQFFDSLLLTQYFSCDNQIAQWLIGQNISIMIPNYKDMLNQKVTIQIINIRFFDQNKIPISTIVELQNSQSVKKKLNEEYFCDYSAEVEIVFRNIQNLIRYKLLRLRKIKRLQKNEEMSLSLIQNEQTQMKGNSQINESIQIRNPYANDEIDENQDWENAEKDQSKFTPAVVQNEQQKLILNNPYHQLGIEQNQQKKVLSILQEANTEKHFKIYNKQTEKASSQQTLQKLEYYKQFRIVHELLNSKKKPKSLLSIVMLIVLINITSLIGFSLYLYEIDMFHKYIRDFKLLKIKNDIFYPILSFQIIRFTIVNYSVQLITQQLTQNQFQQFVQFPESKIIGSYEILKAGISEILEQQEIFDMFDDEQFVLQFLQSNYKGVIKKLDLRSTLSTLLNYQFDIQNTYIKTGAPDTKSANFYFQYKNFPSMLNTFQVINKKALTECTNYAAFKENLIDLIAVSFIIIIFIIEIGILLFSIQVQTQKVKLKQLLSLYEQKYAYFEQQRLQILLEQMEQHTEFALNYTFNIHEKESYFKYVKETQMVWNQKKQIVQKKIKFQPLHFIFKVINFILCFLVFFIFQIKIKQVHNKIQNTVLLYQTFIDLNINTLVIYLTREALYYRSAFPFLDNSDINSYYQINKDALNEINNYVETIWALQYTNLLIELNFFELLQSFSESNLCDQLNQINNNSRIICSQTLQGLLLKGFSSTIISLKNSISTELIQTNFTTRTQFPKLELEGVYLLCYSIQYLLDNFSINFFKYNQEIELQYTIIVVICIIISLLYGAFLLKYLQIVEWKNFQLLMKFFYIVPQSAIILDDSFLRNTRIFIKNDHLI